MRTNVQADFQTSTEKMSVNTEADWAYFFCLSYCGSMEKRVARATISFPGLLLSLDVELVIDVERDEALGTRLARAIERIRRLCIDFQVSAHNTLPMLKTHNFEL